MVQSLGNITRKAYENFKHRIPSASTIVVIASLAAYAIACSSKKNDTGPVEPESKFIKGVSELNITPKKAYEYQNQEVSLDGKYKEVTTNGTDNNVKAKSMTLMYQEQQSTLPKIILKSVDNDNRIEYKFNADQKIKPGTHFYWVESISKKDGKLYISDNQFLEFIGLNKGLSKLTIPEGDYKVNDPINVSGTLEVEYSDGLKSTTVPADSMKIFYVNDTLGNDGGRIVIAKNTGQSKIETSYSNTVEGANEFMFVSYLGGKEYSSAEKTIDVKKADQLNLTDYSPQDLNKTIEQLTSIPFSVQVNQTNVNYQWTKNSSSVGSNQNSYSETFNITGNDKINVDVTNSNETVNQLWNITTINTPADMTVNPDKTEYAVGDTIWYDVTANDPTRLKELGFDFNNDGTIDQLISGLTNTNFNGRVFYIANKEGTIDGLAYATDQADDKLTFTITPITINPSTEPGFNLSLHVMDLENSNPVVGDIVKALLQPSGVVAETDTTDNNGDITLKLEEGTYRLKYNHDDFYERITEPFTLIADSTGQEVRLNKETFPLDLLNYLSRGSTATGQVARWKKAPTEIIYNTNPEKTWVQPIDTTAYDMIKDVNDNILVPATTTIRYPISILKDIPINKKNDRILDWWNGEYIPGKIVIQYDDSVGVKTAAPGAALTKTVFVNGAERMDGYVVTVVSYLQNSKGLWIHELMRLFRVNSNVSARDPRFGETAFRGNWRKPYLPNPDFLILQGIFSRPTHWKNPDMSPYK